MEYGRIKIILLPAWTLSPMSSHTYPAGLILMTILSLMSRTSISMLPLWVENQWLSRKPLRFLGIVETPTPVHLASTMLSTSLQWENNGHCEALQLLRHLVSTQGSSNYQALNLKGVTCWYYYFKINWFNPFVIYMQCFFSSSPYLLPPVHRQL